jgi:hypothetical protein
MKHFRNTQDLKMNFLEIWRGISAEDTQALLNLEKMGVIEAKVKKYCTKEFPIQRVLLIFHAYASIAYITAELKVNAKIYLDYLKRDFMLLTYKKNSKPDTCSIVYATQQELCNHPFYPVPVKDIFECIEGQSVIADLVEFYKKNAL